jgi:hypothetical protein
MYVVCALVLQLAASLLLAPRIMALAPLGRAYQVAYAVLLGVLVWLAGLIVARVLKAMHGPRAATLAASIIGALVGVGVVLLPTVVPSTENVVHLISEPLYLVAGALLGYWVLR